MSLLRAVLVSTVLLCAAVIGAGQQETAPLPQGAAAIPRAPAVVDVGPEQNLQREIDSHPPGTTFRLRDGTYRLDAPLVPKGGQTFEGSGHTVLSGARVLDRFVRLGALWVAERQTQQGTVDGDASICMPDAPRCAWPEELFIDNTALRQAAALADVRRGTWFFDYAAGRIYLADDPAGHLIETSVTPAAFDGWSAGVRLRALTIEKFATPTHHAAVDGRGPGWSIERCDVRWNHFAGVRTVDGATARANTVHHNGALGLIGSGADITIADNEIAFNNTAGYQPDWGAGGAKWVFTERLAVRGNFAHHNRGPGLWTDMNNVRVLFENNRVEDNDASGIFHEVGYSAVIRNNTISRNGGRRSYPGWVDGAGILVAGSSDVEVYGNTLVDNWQGIAGLEGHRGAGSRGPWELKNLYVHDNTITLTRNPGPGWGRSGIIDTAGAGAFHRQNRWSNNTYRSSNDAPPRFIWMGEELDLAGWRRYGNDVTATLVR
jgi:hypothetical protein